MPLDIKIKRNIDAQRHTALTVELGGSLDTATAPQLEKQLAAALDPQVKYLIFDLANLSFVSSAGLRIFAGARKTMKERGEQVSFIHMQPQIAEVFEIVKALPGVAVFGSVAEFDAYLTIRQQQHQQNS